jgi:hypothetical protein
MSQVIYQVANTGKNEKNSFWETNSKLLISAMALHLIATERAPAFSRLADILTTQSYKGSHRKRGKTDAKLRMRLSGDFT